MKSLNCWELATLVVGHTYRALLYGVSGTGKSHFARLHGMQSDSPCYSISLTEETPAAELRGHYILRGGEYVWADGPVIRAWREGCRLIVNELEKSSRDALDFLLCALDDRQIAQTTLPTGETVRPAAGFHVIGTMNGDPDVDLPSALRDRFSECSILIDKVHPGALEALPLDLRGPAARAAEQVDPARRLSVRSWLGFAHLREQVGPDAAAQAVFGRRGADILGALKLAR